MKILKWALGIAAALLLWSAPASAQNIAVRGWCEAGNTPVVTSGLRSTTKVQASYPACTVTVNLTGGGAATIFSDAAGTPLANPFTANTNGQWTFFIAAPTTIDVVNSGAGLPTPVTYHSISVGASGGGGGGVVNVTGVAPIVSSGGITPAISIADCTSTMRGAVPTPPNDPTKFLDGSCNFTAPTATFPDVTPGSLSIKGPIPWRDFTAYMPEGGCSSTSFSDPNTTGSITGGTATLTLASAIDLKNGCGIAVLGAGPTATLVMPSTCTASVSRASNVVTATCSGNHNIFNGTPPSGVDESVTISGCSDGTFNSVTAALQTVPGSTTFTYNQTAANSTATGCTMTFIIGLAHGTTGATTYYYKFAAGDTNGGLSAAVGPVTIANGNASLTADNYNWVGWDAITGAKFVCVYRSTDNVTYTAVGTSLTLGYTDRGMTFPVMKHCGTTLPAAPTAGQLSTTIVSGGGTTTLTLTATASNTATAQPVYHDESSFLVSCLLDVASDQGGGSWAVGSHGCLIPAGNWYFSSNFLENAGNPTTTGGTAIYVDGTIVLNLWPIIQKENTQDILFQGMGFSGQDVNSMHAATTNVHTGANVPAAFELHGRVASIKNFAFPTLRGNGIETSPGVGGNYSLSSFGFEDLRFNESAGNTAGVPLVFNSNTLFVYSKNLSFTPNQTGIPASIQFTNSTYSGNTWCCFNFTDIFWNYHGVLFDSPGGNNAGQGAPIQFNHIESENRGVYPTGGIVTVDTGNVAGVPGAASSNLNLPALLISALDNADTNGNAVPLNTLIYAKGKNGLSKTDVTIHASSELRTLDCPADSAAACNAAEVRVNSDLQQNLTTQAKYVGRDTNKSYVIGYPLVSYVAGEDYLRSPAPPAWANALPPILQPTVNSTGAGSLAAQQYCIVIVGLDGQSTPGKTTGSPETCVTVGASSSINLTWYAPDRTGYGNEEYSDYRLYYGSVPGGEDHYIDTAIAPSFGTSVTYNFTSTAGNVAGAPPTAPTAFFSWLMPESDTVSCLLCPAGASQSIHWRMGVGDTAPPTGIKFSVKGGGLGAPYLQSIEAAAASGVASSDLLYPDSTLHRWAMKNNNGAAEGVVGGTGAITSGHCAQWSATYTLIDNGSACGSGGTGTVTSFSSGNLSPLFTTSVATAGTTPALSFSLSTAAAHTFYMNNTGSTAAPGFQTAGEADLPATTVWTDQNATFGAHTYDATAATIFKLRAGAGATASASGDIAEDTTAANWHAYNGADSILGLKPTATSVADNDCVKWTVAGSKITLNTAGAACSTSASANQQLSNLSGTVAFNLSLVPDAAGTRAIGSNALPVSSLFFGTAANQTASFVTSALTTNRNITVPDAATILPQSTAGTAGQFLTALSGATGVFSTSSLTYSGNTTKLVTFGAGSTTTGDVATFDASGNVIDGGTAVSNSSTNTFTNKTLDQEGSGNVVTTVVTAWFDAAGCNNATASPSFDLPSSNAPTANCLTGTNTNQGTLDYSDSANSSGQIKLALPHTWVGAIDVQLYWLVTATGGSNAVKWTIQTAFTAGAATYDTAFNAAQTITANVAANNIVTESAQSALTLTGSAVDDILHIKIGRDTTDTFTGTARLLGARLTLRKTGS